MNKNDKHEFVKIMKTTSDYYRATYRSTKEITPEVAQMYFDGLSDHSVDCIRRALGKHMRNSKSGAFFPKISDINTHAMHDPFNRDWAKSWLDNRGAA